MGDSIDSVVKSWLVDPNWQKVFKHTFDVFQVRIPLPTKAVKIKLVPF
jgi:hypothetical protein